MQILTRQGRPPVAPPLPPSGPWQDQLGDPAAVQDPQAGPNQKQGLFRIGNQEHMRAPKAAKPMGAGDHFLGCHGDATERSIPERDEGHGSEPANEADDSMGQGACQTMKVHAQMPRWIMPSGKAKQTLWHRPR